LAVATIVQTKSGTWQAVVRRKGTKPVKKTFTRKTDATNWARTIEADIERGEYRPETKGERLSFSDLVKQFTDDAEAGLPTLSAGQRRTVPGVLEFWSEQFGHLRLKNVTAEEIEEAAELLRQRRKVVKSGEDFKDLGPISPSTVRKYLSILGTVFKFAVKKRLLRASPLREVHKPAADDERTRYLSQEEVTALLDAVDQSDTPELPIAVRLAMFTGLRKSELFGLTWERVNLKDAPILYQGSGKPFAIPPRHVLVEITKNGHPRFVPLAGPALEALKAWGKVRPLDGTALVFPSRETASKPLDVRTPWKTALRRAKIENFRWHDLRHTFASWLMMIGTSHIEIAKLTGHRDMKSLMRYSHLAPEHASGIVDGLAERLEGKKQ
jgi:integrase